MDAEAIQEIANQLGITVDAVTKEVVPAFAQFETANYIFGGYSIWVFIRFDFNFNDIFY